MKRGDIKKVQPDGSYTVGFLLYQMKTKEQKKGVKFINAEIHQ